MPAADAAAGVGDLLGDGRRQLVVHGVGGVFVLSIQGAGFGRPQWVPVVGAEFASDVSASVVQVGPRAEIIESFNDGRVVGLIATGIGGRSRLTLAGGRVGFTPRDAYVTGDVYAMSQPDGAAYVGLSCSSGSTPCPAQVTLSQGGRMIGSAAADIAPGGFERVRVPTTGGRTGARVDVVVADSATLQHAARVLAPATPADTDSACEPPGARVAARDAAATAFIAPDTQDTVAIACDRRTGRWIELPIFNTYSQFRVYGTYVAALGEACDDAMDQTCSPDVAVVNVARPGREIEAFGFLPRLDLPFPTPCPPGGGTCGPDIASYAIGAHGNLAVLLCPFAATRGAHCQPGAARDLVSLDATGTHTVAASPRISAASLRREKDPRRFAWTDSGGRFAATWHGAVHPALYDATSLLPYTPTFPPPRVAR